MKFSTTFVLAFVLTNTYTLAQRMPESNQKRVIRVEMPRFKLVQLKNFNGWDRQYIGKRTIKLTDHPELAQSQSRAVSLNKVFSASNKNLADTVSEHKQLTSTLEANKKKLNELNTSITNNNKKKQNQNKQLQTAQSKVKNLQNNANSTQNQLAQTNKNIINKRNQRNALVKKRDALKCGPNNSKCLEQKKKLNQEVASHNQVIKQLLNVQKRRQIARNQAANALKVNQSKINNLKKSIANLNKQITKDSNQKRLFSQRVTSINNSLAQKLKKFQNLSQVAANQAKLRNDAFVRANNIKSVVINNILEVNNNGAYRGEEDGSIDGDYLAEYRGTTIGANHGDRDGQRDGVARAKKISYDLGHSKGLVEGRSQATADGSRNGEEQGILNAYSDLATNEATQAGIQRALNSDASSLGKTQGNDAGLARAIKEGKTIGNRSGINQAIKKNEQTPLEAQTVNGQFVGSFAPSTPGYPGFNCVQNESDLYRGRFYTIDRRACPDFRVADARVFTTARFQIFKSAYIDAYLLGFKHNRRNQYLQSVGHYYHRTYNNTYDATYADFSNRHYQSNFQQGYNDAHKKSYDLQYPISFDMSYDLAYRQTTSTPNRSHSTYTQTFAQIEPSAYKKEYDRIFQNQYAQSENQTYSKNIQEQIALFTKKAFAHTNKEYLSKPVIKFESFTNTDSGVNGIGANDGVYQPSEDIGYHVNVKNFGAINASGLYIKVINNNGQTQKINLPEVPAKSNTTIKLAAKSSVNTQSVGTTIKNTLQLIGSAKKGIAARHFSNANTGEIGSAINFNYLVDYPLKVTNLSFNSDLIKGQTKKINLSVSNTSGRAYTGKLSIQLSHNGTSDIIKAPFANLSGLKNTVSLDSAKLRVDSESDLYKELYLTAQITKDGVTVAKLQRPFRFIAKDLYKSGNSTVIMADGDFFGLDIKMIANKLGGLDKVSILDTSLDSHQKQIYNNGLDKKSIIVLDDHRHLSHSSVASLLVKTEDSSLLFVDNRLEQISSFKSRFSIMSNSIKLTNLIGPANKKKDLYYTNRWLDGVKDITVIAQTNDENFLEDYQALKPFNRLNVELVAAAKNAIATNTWNRSNSDVKTMTSMAAAQIMAISKAMDKTDNSAYLNNLKTDQLIYQKMLHLVKGQRVSNSNIRTVLAVVAMSHVLDNAAEDFSDIKDHINYRVERVMEDEIKDVMKGDGLRIFTKGIYNYLKDYNRGLYNMVDDNKYVHSPFAI